MNQERIERRIQILEGRLIPRGCDVCITWTGYLLVTIDGDTNQEIERSHPDTCPNCSRVVPTVREVHLIEGGA